MDTTAPETQVRVASGENDDLIDRRLERRNLLRHRHAKELTRLMTDREDLRGVHALADFVDDAVRWTA